MKMILDFPVFLKFCFILASVWPLHYCDCLQFQDGHIYSYSYEAWVHFSEIPVTGSTHKQAGVRILIDVDLHPVYSSDGVQIIKLQIVSAKVQSVGRPQQTTTLPQLLMYPILFELKGTAIDIVYTVPRDSVLAINIKKGIASLFQVDTHVDVKTEIDVSGDCDVSYSIRDSSLIKTKIHCRKLELSAQFSHPNKILGLAVTPVATVHYELNDGVIQKATASHTVSANVNIRTSLNGQVRSGQLLSLKGTSARAASIQAASLEEAVEKLNTNLGYVLLPGLLPSEAERQECDESCVSSASLVSKHTDVLTKENLATVASAQAFLELVKSFRNSGKMTIAEILTSPDSYYIVPQLIDIATSTQTQASHEALMELLNFDDEYSIEHPERYLLALAYSTHPDEYVITDLMRLAKKKVPNLSLRESILLSLGAVVQRYCQSPQQCQAQIITDYLDHMNAEIKACSSSDCPAMFLRSLGNSRLAQAVPTLLEYTESGIGGDVALASVQALELIPLDNQNWKQILTVMQRIFYESHRQYDTSIRAIALEILLRLDPTPADIGSIILVATDRECFQFSSYILALLKENMKINSNLRTSVTKALASSRLQNYDIFGQIGSSNVYVGHLSATEDVESRYSLFMENSKLGVMKRSSMVVDMAMDEKNNLRLLTVGLYADGLESMLGDEEEGEGEGGAQNGGSEDAEQEATAGMSLHLLGVLLRPIEFFRGSGGLMSAVWNAPSEPISALQANILLHDHLEQIHLSNGLIVELNVMGAASIDLSGSISISLWYRSSHSLVKNSGALAVHGSLTLISDVIKAGLEFSASGASVMDFTTDVDFYEMPMKMCLQMSQPAFTFVEKNTKFENIKLLRKRLKMNKTKRAHINAASFPLYEKNSRLCRDFAETQE